MSILTRILGGNETVLITPTLKTEDEKISGATRFYLALMDDLAEDEAWEHATHELNHALIDDGSGTIHYDNVYPTPLGRLKGKKIIGQAGYRLSRQVSEAELLDMLRLHPDPSGGDLEMIRRLSKKLGR